MVKRPEMVNSAIELNETILVSSNFISPAYTLENRKKIPVKTKIVFVKVPVRPASRSPFLFFINL